MNFVQTVLVAAKTVKISGAILLAICIQESKLNNILVHQDGGSPSYGICQVKHETATMLGYKGAPTGLMNPNTNAKYAALYLKYQFDRYHNWCMAVAAFNAGRFNPSRIEPGHPRNMRYVVNVRKRLNKNFQSALSCDNVPIGDTDVAENHGP